MKLKIKHVNESIDKDTLNEADVDRGYRIKAIEKLSAKVGEKIQAAGYKYKPVSQTGFYIIPDFGYLSKLKITGTDDEDPTFTIKVNDIFAKDLEVGGKVLSTISYEELIELTDDIGEAMARTLIAPASFDGISENLSEDLLLEYGPWSSVKGLFSKAVNAVKDFTATKAADKAEKRAAKAILEGINETLTDSLNAAIKLLLKDGKQYVKVVSKIDGNSLILELKCDFVTAITFSADPRDARKVVTSKLLTPLGEVNVKGKTIEKVLAMVGKVLNINFGDAAQSAEVEVAPDANDNETDTKADPDDDNDSPDLADNGGEEEKKSNESSNVWKRLIGDDAWAELTGVGEDLTQPLNEAYRLKIPAAKYQKAFDMVKDDDDASIALIRYYLKQETGNVLSDDPNKIFDYKIIDDIRDIIKANRTFNPNACFPLLYILTYIKSRKAINVMVVALAPELPKSCQKASILEQPQSIVYSKYLLESSSNPSTLAALIDKWYTSRAIRDILPKLPAVWKQHLVDKFDFSDSFGKIEAFKPGDKSHKKEMLALKKECLLDAGAKRFRSLSDIKAIENAIIEEHNEWIKSSKGKKAENPSDLDSDEDDTELAPVVSDDELVAKLAGDVDNVDEKSLKQLLKIAGDRGIKDATLKVELTKAVLKALGELA